MSITVISYVEFIGPDYLFNENVLSFITLSFYLITLINCLIQYSLNELITLFYWTFCRFKLITCFKFSLICLNSLSLSYLVYLFLYLIN